MTPEARNKAADKHMRDTARRCVRSAQSVLTAGWVHVSKDLREGLVMREIVHVITGQDEGNDPASVLKYMHDLVRETQRILNDNPGRLI